MIELLQGIVDFISSIGSFFVSFLSSILDLFKYIGVALETVAVTVLYLPEELIVIGFAFVSMAVVFLITGR